MNMKYLIAFTLFALLTFGNQLNGQGVVINEVVTDGNDYVEIANLSALAVDISGWTVTMTTDPSAQVSVTFPATTIIAPNETIVIAENASLPVLPGGTQRFSIANIVWVVNTGGACALNDNNDVGQDLILFGNPSNLPTGSPLSSFTGSVPSGGANTQDVFQRISNNDSDTDADWVMSPSGTGSPGALNAGQSGVPAPPTASFAATPTTSTVGTPIQFVDQSLGQPTSWAWDFDGDNITDSTSQNPSFAYGATGFYTVRLTVTNSFGSDTSILNSFIQIIVPPTIPFLDEFNNGSLNSAWSLSSTTIGQIYVGNPPSTSPGSGGDALIFEATATGTVYLNQATLIIDLSAETEVIVKYLARESGDEPDANDGLFVSDGVQTLLAVSHQGLTSAWQEIEFDLGAFVTANGMSLTSTFELIFSQQDNFDLPSDGLLIDDVRVELPPVPDIGQANQPLAFMDIAGGVNINGKSAVIGENGPFFVNSSQLDISFGGTPGYPWILLAGPLNRNNQVFVPQGSLDIGTMGATSNYSDIFPVIDGLNPVAFFDFLATLNSSGAGSLSVNFDNLPPGIITTLQALIYQPGSPFVQLTAAFEFTVP